MSDQVYLNGEFLPIEDAKISVMDRGFLFGDSIYEVIPAYNGRMFRLAHHLERLENGLQAIGMDSPMSRDEWGSTLNQLIQQNPEQDQSIYLQVTRGPAEKRDHALPATIQPTVFAMATPIQEEPSENSGIAAITLDDIRWRLCNIKATTLLANVLLKQQAKDAKAAEAILIRDGEAVEGAASNLFIVSKRELITPPKSNYLLPGITRDLILELAAKNGISYLERAIQEEELETADEIWLTSSTKEIMPVITLNGKPVASAIPGELYKRMSAIYTEYKERIKQGLEE
jgi:D-alanine transaminase